ncbi:MAG: hypothetical protein LAQ69_38495 [Acidobacteriia bacterium]|nr:hypothetical protein [Terriglobia bacterium]
MKIRGQYLLCSSAAVLASTFSIQCLAQSATPQLARVTITHVKPDMLNEWLDLQKNEVVPGLKKAGQKTRTVYGTSLFGNSYEFVVITPFEKYAEFDAGNPLTKALGQPASARLGEKLRKCTISSTSYAITRLADLSNVLDGPPPQMLVSARYRITPGKTQDFQNLVKSEILPVYKKAKVGLIVSQRGAGANPNDVTMSTVYSKFADMDGGPFLVKQLGQEGANKVNAKFVGIRTLIEVVVRSRVEDLSF